MFIIGVGKDTQEIPFMHASFREIDIRFQFRLVPRILETHPNAAPFLWLTRFSGRYRETYPKAIMLVAEGLIDLTPLVTHRFRLEESSEAFAAASTPSARAVKVQLLDD